MKKIPLVAFAVIACATAAQAQTPAAPATAVTDSGMAPPACKKPDPADLDAPAKGTDAGQTGRIRSKTSTASPSQKQFDDYRNCIVAYSNTQSALAKKHNDAANAAISELNALVVQINKAQGN